MCTVVMFLMKKIILSIVFSLILINSVFADVYVNPYYRSDGTYVGGHYRSSPDSSVSNNWSYSGNTNPYTGEVGSKTRLSASARPQRRQQPCDGAPRVLHL